MYLRLLQYLTKKKMIVDCSKRENLTATNNHNKTGTIMG